ncbi:MAG: 1-deoxy-D-xylulose-5-phosphate synthase N-terminal domain-containing protein [Candidatus Methylomirabilales bacterium]
MAFELGPRRGTYLDASHLDQTVLPADELQQFESLDLIYRALCTLCYNYVPMSGHPGGSISAGRILAALVFSTLDYDLADPDREDADILSFAAGHKAMGLYSLWAIRDEVARLGAPALLPKENRQRLRLEDLLGFRRNPITRTPRFREFKAKALDGHPTPATPFIRLSTGASGVGVASSLGLAFAARDYYGAQAPRVHVVEGEGGLTPGRAAEALAAAGTASLDNVIVHVDWNQASIDSNRVCPEAGQPGDYVQWTPMELFRLHDWNVIFVPDGKDLRQVVAAQRAALGMESGQPTAVVYRTVKGWQYGMEGRASHGAGHKLCSDGFCQALAGLTGRAGMMVPTCEAGKERCLASPNQAAVIEACFWESLQIVRQVIEASGPMVQALARRLLAARDRLTALNRQPRPEAPRVEAVYALAAKAGPPPAELALKPGTVTTLRAELGRVLQHYNQASGGAVLSASADLLGSTSINVAGAGFPPGYWNAATNPAARLLSLGGICEDGGSGILSGVSTFGHHIGVGSSYGAFIAPLSHIAARLHAIGGQARRAASGAPYRPMIVVCAHAGLKTGEDGPTHADPQPLQILQENFPRGTAITLTPWDPREVWPLLAAALSRRPAVIAPFVTRPNETVLDRTALRLAPVEATATGVYLLRAPRGKGEGTIVLQESAAAYAFLEDALPLLDRDGLDPWVYYVSSAELFDLLPPARQQRLFPEERAREAMGITGFTLPTMFRWVRSDLGRSLTLHPFRKGHFLGSGQGPMVLAEAGLDGVSQHRAIKKYLDALARVRKARSARRPAAAAARRAKQPGGRPR